MIRCIEIGTTTTQGVFVADEFKTKACGPISWTAPTGRIVIRVGNETYIGWPVEKE